MENILLSCAYKGNSLQVRFRQQGNQIVLETTDGRIFANITQFRNSVVSDPSLRNGNQISNIDVYFGPNIFMGKYRNFKQLSRADGLAGIFEAISEHMGIYPRVQQPLQYGQIDSQTTPPQSGNQNIQEQPSIQNNEQLATRSVELLSDPNQRDDVITQQSGNQNAQEQSSIQNNEATQQSGNQNIQEQPPIQNNEQLATRSVELLSDPNQRDDVITQQSGNQNAQEQSSIQNNEATQQSGNQNTQEQPPIQNNEQLATRSVELLSVINEDVDVRYIIQQLLLLSLNKRKRIVNELLTSTQRDSD